MIAPPPYFVSFERRPHEDDGPHGGDHVVGRDVLHLRRGKFHNQPHEAHTDQHQPSRNHPLRRGPPLTDAGLHLFYRPSTDVSEAAINFSPQSVRFLFLTLLSHIIKASIIKPGGAASGERGDRSLTPSHLFSRQLVNTDLK